VGAAIHPVMANISAGAYLVSVVAVDGSGLSSDAASGTVNFVSAGFSQVKVYPNPWRADKHTGRPAMTFAGLTVGTTIKIFTLAGRQVRKLATDGPSLAWDLNDESGNKVASGVYPYLITDGQGGKTKGKIAIIR